MIEDKIAATIEALNTNTAALLESNALMRQVIALRGASASVAAEQPEVPATETKKPAAGKKPAKETPKPKEPEPEPEEEEVTGLDDEEEETVVTHEDIRATHKKLSEDKDKVPAINKAFVGLLREFGAVTDEEPPKPSLTKLAADQCADFRKKFIAAVEAA